MIVRRLRGLIALLIVSSALAEAELPLKGTRPHIVVFIGDDQSRFDHAAYGHETVPTPTTEAFAKEALVFDRAFTGQAICSPSRSMLYTGLYPIRNGCFLNHCKIRPEVKSIPSYLEELGYTVVLAGKSHVGLEKQFPWSDRFRPRRQEDLPRKWIPIEMIRNLLAKPGDKPLCLIVASEFPHPPYFKKSKFRPEEVKLPPFLEDTEENRRAAARYYANIAEKEKEFAAVLKALDESELKEESIVFYTDDHGASRGKFSVYDSGLNVAFMVRWPEKIKPGRTQTLTSFADFVPTLIELAGGEVSSDLDGKSLLPLLEGKAADHHRYVYGLTVNQGTLNRHVFPQRSVRDERYHYIYSFNSLERIRRDRAAGKKINYFREIGAVKHPETPEELLFDTLRDPHEMVNLAQKAKLQEIKKRLKAELFRWMKEQGDYLSEGGPLPLFQVEERFSLDVADMLNQIPKSQVGVLDGTTVHPHRVTASETR